MKFELTFRAKNLYEQILDCKELQCEQKNESDEIYNFLKQFLDDEYITIKFDTETKTATVVEYK